MSSQIERLSDDIDACGLSVDATVETLTDRRCRNVLEYLVRGPCPANVDEIASCFPVDGDDESNERAALRLHHVVLPKLADAGLIRYDPAENVAELAESSARVNEYLRRTGRYGLV